jgi:hypothetical protein
MAQGQRASHGSTVAGDEDTFSERFITVFRKTLNWASPATNKIDGGKPAGCSGCLNPVTLFKLILVLLLVVFMPLFMLPMMIVWAVKSGRKAVKYASAFDITSGQEARFGQGALGPPADPDSVRAGLAAIAAHDAEFDPAKLMNWATAATDLIRTSLTSGDATPARTFMANGLFRSYNALIELRGQAEVACEGSWRATRSTVIDAFSTPLVDEVRVRLECTGWCWDQHQPTGLTLRGSPDTRTWSEDLTFGRSATATSPAAGGLPAKRCPSCGADLDLDENGVCRYCNSVVTAGRQDWVLLSARCCSSRLNGTGRGSAPLTRLIKVISY